MGVTPNGFRYPEQADAADVALRIQHLAEDADSKHSVVKQVDTADIPAPGIVGRELQINPTHGVAPRIYDNGVEWYSPMPDPIRAGWRAGYLSNLAFEWHQTIPNSVVTPIDWGHAAMEQDRRSGIGEGGNATTNRSPGRVAGATTRIEVPFQGVYLISVALQWAASSVGKRFVDVILEKPDGTVPGIGYSTGSRLRDRRTAVDNAETVVTGIADFSPNNRFHVDVLQSSGAPLDLVAVRLGVVLIAPGLFV